MFQDLIIVLQLPPAAARPAHAHVCVCARAFHTFGSKIKTVQIFLQEKTDGDPPRPPPSPSVDNDKHVLSQERRGHLNPQRTRFPSRAGVTSSIISRMSACSFTRSKHHIMPRLHLLPPPPPLARVGETSSDIIQLCSCGTIHPQRRGTPCPGNRGSCCVPTVCVL